MLVKYNKGITLLETVMAVALLFTIVSLAYMIYFTGFSAFRRNAERVDLQQSVRHSMSIITKRLLNANDSGVTFTGIPLELRIRNEQNGQTEAFRLNGNTLEVNYNRLSGTSPFNPMATGITEFSFTRNARTIEVTISAGRIQDNNQFNLSTQILLRRQ